jgi:transcription elongation factor GreA
MSDIKYYTEEGLKALKDELYQLERIERPKVSQQIGEAIEKGDLSENAEYHAAKEVQGLMEGKIVQLRNIVANARILDDSMIDNSKVLILSKVTIKNVKSGMEVQYTLVAENEANLKTKKISIDSPIGKGLMRKAVGDIADIQTPRGIIQFEIIDITR